MVKLKSRKFWIAIIIIAYGVIMGIRESGTDNQIAAIACIAAAAVAGVAYVIAEALVDKDSNGAVEAALLGLTSGLLERKEDKEEDEEEGKNDD